MIRQAVVNDAKNLAALIQQVENESAYMLYEPGERTSTAEKQRKMIEVLTAKENSVIFVAEEADNLVGYLLAIGGNMHRNKHSAYLVIGITFANRGKGIGTVLFKELEHWAVKQGLHRLELTVVSENVAGLALYQNAGFEIEGVKKDSLFINGTYVDEYYMGKLL